MTDAILIFTFSPIQPFIVEARRASDLYNGSQILVELAKAAAEAIIGKGNLIYPAELTDDVPNKIVARVDVDFDKVDDTLIKSIKDKFFNRWKGIANQARRSFNQSFENDIWNTQIEDNNYLWEIYWAIAKLDGRSYSATYQEADNAISALKFTRPFKQYPERGFKDTLSGKRQALHDGNTDGKEYWEKVINSGGFTPAQLRPGERLDSMGVVKRFRELGDATRQSLRPFFGFPSTSSIASADFLEKARNKLAKYVSALEVLGAETQAFINIRDGENFPYDGDLLYVETLTPKRLKDDHGIKDRGGNPCKEGQLNNPRNELLALYKELDERPSPYYAIVTLDGDGMGEAINNCGEEKDHKELSKKISSFALAVQNTFKGNNDYYARIIYNGGDDLLAMCPLSTAIDFAQSLHEMFNSHTQLNASAGIAISHHTSPLSAALRAARTAQDKAKDVDGKNALCVSVLRRSGERLEMRSHWNEAAYLKDMIKFFKDDTLSTKFPYEVAQAAYALPEADEKFESEIKRLLKRHTTKREEEKKAWAKEWAGKLKGWADLLPEKTEELGRWLALARFISQGGAQ